MTIGVDETGRGSVFGPIITCAAVLPKEVPAELMAKLNDSKKLSAKRRFELATELHECAHYAFGAVSARQVDSLNPLKGTMLAMCRAVSRLGYEKGRAYVMVDGPYFPDAIEHPGEAVVKGDGKVPEIMAASILAKVFRDHMLAVMSGRYPVYGLEKHSGYGTRAHFDAILEHGETPHHRASFLKKFKAAA